MYNLKLAFKNICHRKGRTVFTVLSIAVGITSVLIISVISSFGKEAVNSELDHLGINGLMLTAHSQNGASVLSTDDLDILREIDDVQAAIPIVTYSGHITVDGKTQPLLIWGIDSGADQIISLEMTDGEEINTQNVLNSEYVCLADNAVANNVGDKIQVYINKSAYNFQIKGKVTADSGIMQALAGDYLPPIIYVPYTTLQEMLNKTEISQIAVKVKDTSTESVDIIGKNIEREIKSLKTDTDTVYTENLVRQRNRLNNMLNIITIALSAIGVVSLIVAGLSIMTVMMMSVNERTKEIGIKRAMGAGKTAVMGEILTETVIICLVGSAVGLLLTTVVTFAGKYLGFDVGLSATHVIITILIACVGGVVFGIYPAMLAARLNPTEALRKD